MHKVVLCTLLLTALCLSVSGQVQTTPALFEKVERVFREKEPRWGVEKVYRGSDPISPKLDIVFKAGKTQAAISVIIWNDVKVAQEVFEGSTIVKNNIRGKGSTRQKLSNLGDESYMWANRSSGTWPTLLFRKGNVLVNVFAPDIKTAKRFAKLIEREIP